MSEDLGPGRFTADHYTRIGRKGGKKLKAARGAGYLSQIGKKGGARTRALIRRGLALEAEENADDRRQKA